MMSGIGESDSDHSLWDAVEAGRVEEAKSLIHGAANFNFSEVLIVHLKEL